MLETDLLRIRQESQKFMEIDNIFNRLSQNYINKIYTLFKEIFHSEHQYTIQELLKLALVKEIPLREFKLTEHYKLNSHIFKSNLQLIINLVVEDIYGQYHKLVTSDEFKLPEPRQLTQIDEEQEQCQSDIFSEIEDLENKIKITPRQDQRNCFSQRVPLQKLLQDNSSHSSKYQSITNSPKSQKDVYKEQLQKVRQAQQNLQNTKKKNSQIMKNKSMDFKNLTDQLINNKVQSPKSQNNIPGFNNIVQRMQMQGCFQKQ
ncbi:hypothetical protein pb186bvf_019154 [Paramecium bursaria]